MEQLDTPLQPISQTVTLGERAYNKIRNAIATGVLEPGARLRERELAEKLGISATPIREALQKLEKEGLVVKKDNRGRYVADIALSEVSEIVLIDAALKGIAARLASQKITDEELNSLMKVLQNFNAVIDTASEEELLDLSHQFHAMVYKACRNQVLLNLIDTTTAFDRRLRLRVLRETGRLVTEEHLAKEHKEIADALSAHDGDQAEELMRSHTIKIGRILLNAINSRSID